MEEISQPEPEINNTEDSGFLKKYGSSIWEFAKIIIIALLIVLPIRYFLFQPFVVKGDSMVPNFHSGDYLIVDEISYRFGAPARGDVIVFDTSFIPGYQGQRFIKRVIGLPGETVQVSNGKIHIISNGKNMQLDEKQYLPDLKSTNGDVNVTLDANSYFVMGDNRLFSYDSRMWGVLPKKDIVGKALVRVLPISAMSYITGQTY